MTVPFEPLQVVYAADKLDNYADIAKIGVGAACHCNRYDFRDARCKTAL